MKQKGAVFVEAALIIPLTIVLLWTIVRWELNEFKTVGDAMEKQEMPVCIAPAAALSRYGLEQL